MGHYHGAQAEDQAQKKEVKPVMPVFFSSCNILLKYHLNGSCGDCLILLKLVLSSESNTRLFTVATTEALKHI